VNTAFFHTLVNWPKSFITGTDLRVIIPGTDDHRKALVKRAVHEGYLERVKRDLYLIRTIHNKPLPNSFELAQLVYGPSYISFESALSFYGWIPEAVPVVCSASIKQSKNFKTRFSLFSFEKIPNSAFSLSLSWRAEGNANYLMADPWKAIADIIYFRQKKWDSANALMDDLRIEHDSILQSDRTVLEFLLEEYPHQKVRQTLKKISKSIPE
jgi:hypothetical protein